MIKKKIRYDRHARRRMKWRKISQAEVEQVLESPEKTGLTERDRKNAFKTVGERYIKVTYREFEDEVLVISTVDKSD